MKKIMLVDDVAISNFIMKKMISKVPQTFEVYEYVLPELAITEVRDIAPDVIFLDLNMPIINGWEFLDLMKENNQTNQVYILSSSTSELDLDRSRKYENVKDFLVKPIRQNELDHILETLSVIPV